MYRVVCCCDADVVGTVVLACIASCDHDAFTRHQGEQCCARQGVAHPERSAGLVAEVRDESRSKSVEHNERERRSEKCAS